MSNKDFNLAVILLIILAGSILASRIRCITCPCGATEKTYTQIVDSTRNYRIYEEKYLCKRWANCETCEDNTDDCLTCPPGRAGPTCEETGCLDPGSVENGGKTLSNVNVIQPSSEGTSSRYGVGTRIFYFCNSGYILEGKGFLMCTSSGKWSEDMPKCIKETGCLDPGSVENGGKTLSNVNVIQPSSEGTSSRYGVGTRIFYFCNSGYILEGKGYLLCTSSGKWSEDMPKCIKETGCLDPGSVENGGKTLSNVNVIQPSSEGTSSRYGVGTRIFYYCNSGYILEGKGFLMCTSSGKWSEDMPKCIKETGCLDPGSVENGGKTLSNVDVIQPSSEGTSSRYGVGTRIFYFCNSGYILEGKGYLLCTSSGKWSEDMPKCIKETGCLDPGSVENGGKTLSNVDVIQPSSEGTSSRYGVGTGIFYFCNSGYILEGKGFLLCTSSGKWSEDMPKCIKETGCLDPGSVENGGKTLSNVDVIQPSSEGTSSRYGVGTRIFYFCNSGYILEGKGYLLCTSSGKWSEDMPKCIKETGCLDPGSVENGGKTLSNVDVIQPSSEGTSTRYGVGTRILYYCNSGYILEGKGFLLCTSSGKWSEDMPKCIKETGCLDPGSVENGWKTLSNVNVIQPSSEGTSSRYGVGTRILYYCNSGYILEGKGYLMCTSSGKWSEDMPKCIKETGCLDPGSVENGGKTVNNAIVIQPSSEGTSSEYDVGTLIFYHCNSGYRLEGKGNQICIESGLDRKWSEDKPKCIKMKTCPDPGLPDGGYRRNVNGDDESYTRIFQEGEVVYFSCDEDSPLVGPTAISCTLNGTWSDSLPRCEKFKEELLCADPGNVENAGRTVHFKNWVPGNGWPVGTHISYNCHSQYILEGEKDLNCTSYGKWSGNRPKCNGACGRSPLQPGGKFNIGENPVVSDFPWMVLIYMNETGKTCGGVLLNQKSVLTAAHCFKDAESKFELFEDCTLYFGKYNSIDNDDESHVISRECYLSNTHPDFNEDTFDNDIAIISFFPSFNYTSRIQPVCLPSPDSTAVNIIPGQKGYVAGWRLSEGWPESSKLEVANITVRALETCVSIEQETHTRIGEPQGKFCAGLPDEKRYICEGGNASPLVFYNKKTERFEVEGIASKRTSADCNKPEKNILFTRVSHYLEWIRQTLFWL